MVREHSHIEQHNALHERITNVQERVGKVEERLKAGGEAIKRIEVGVAGLSSEMQDGFEKINKAIAALTLAQHDQVRDFKHHMESEEGEIAEITSKIASLKQDIIGFSSHISGCPRTMKIARTPLGEYIDKGKPYIIWVLIGALGMTLISKEAVEKLGVFLKAFSG